MLYGSRHGSRNVTTPYFETFLHIYNEKKTYIPLEKNLICSNIREESYSLTTE
jgi:hypothetical protein